MVADNGGCGTPEPPKDPEPPQREITDETTTMCIKNAVNVARKGQTTISQMLNKTFGRNTEEGGSDVLFKEASLADDLAGTARKNGNFSWEITINSKLINTSSKEYILSTIYHEVLHAYMEATYPKE